MLYYPSQKFDIQVISRRFTVLMRIISATPNERQRRINECRTRTFASIRAIRSSNPSSPIRADPCHPWWLSTLSLEPRWFLSFSQVPLDSDFPALGHPWFSGFPAWASPNPLVSLPSVATSSNFSSVDGKARGRFGAGVHSSA
jgi:hypothetical protein